MMPSSSSSEVGQVRNKKRYRALLWASISVIALVTIFVFLMALAFPSNIPSWSQKIESAHFYFLVIRWSVYTTILYRFTALCRYLVPAASLEKIAYAKKHILGLIIVYEVIVGLQALQYVFDFFFNSSVGI